MKGEGIDVLRCIGALVVVSSVVLSRDYLSGNSTIVEWLEYLMYVGFVVSYGLNILSRNAGWVRVVLETVTQTVLLYWFMSGTDMYMSLGFLSIMVVVLLLPVGKKKENVEIDSYLMSK